MLYFGRDDCYLLVQAGLKGGKYSLGYQTVARCGD